MGKHIDRHLAIADRLWRGDPPELWIAAQRLLDTGEDRHLVLHALMDVLDAAANDKAILKSLLRDLTSGLDDLDNFPLGDKHQSPGLTCAASRRTSGCADRVP